MDIEWHIRREGRSWTGEEFQARMALTPEKLEAYEGKLLWTQEDRIKLLGLLLENVGADEAVKLGDPSIWLSAALNRPRTFWGDPFNRWMLCTSVVCPGSMLALAWLLTSVGLPSERLAYVLLSFAAGAWASIGVRLLLDGGPFGDHSQ